MRHASAKHAVLKSDGNVLILISLPPANTVRWIARRKAQVVAAVQAGQLTRAEACKRYRLSPEEFLEWERHFKTYGVEGLKASVRPAPKPVMH